MSPQSTRAQRRERLARRNRPGLRVRLAAWVRGLQGARRIAFFAGVGLVVVLLFSATGGTAYALNLENHDAFCASCHTQPETQYYQQSQTKDSTTLATLHAHNGVACIDCHSGGGPFGRVGGLTQGAQDLVSYYSGNYHRPAITTSPLGDENCTKCHADVMFRADFNNHFHRFLPRWQAVDSNAAHCVDCHTAHPTGDSTQQFLNTTQVQAICQQCHSAIRE